MASFVKQLVCYFFIVLFSSSLIQARENRFFSKFTHFSTTQTNVKETKLAPVEAPAPAPVEAPAAVEALVPAPEPTTFTTQNQLFDEEFEGGNYEEESQSSNYNNNAYTNNNNGYTGNYNYNNGYQLSSESESHETANQNNYNSAYTTSNYNNKGYYNGYELASGSYETSNQNDKNRYTTNNYNNNNGYINNYDSNGYEADQRQGMSDTRFMQGGKYYYDVKKENSYYPANGYANQVSYGSTNTNEFSTMEGQNEELYDENQEESLP